MSVKPILCREDITTMLYAALQAGDKAQVKALLAENALLKQEGNNEYDLILASRCPYKARLFSTIARVGKTHLKSLQCGGRKMGRQGLLEFVLWQDCEEFTIKFGSHAPIASLAYQNGVLDITHKTRLFTSNAFNRCNAWDFSRLLALFKDLETCLNQPIEDWYAKETMPNDFPFE